ncbi:MAG: hypothetical protein H7832_00870 [Magnetococcus sp. DMHC-6]
MNPIRIFILTLLISLLASSFLENMDGLGLSLSDIIATLALLGVILYFRKKNIAKQQKPFFTNSQQTPSPMEPKPNENTVNIPSMSSKKETDRVIHHPPAWSVIERGDPVGRFRNTAIYNWIRTSDLRSAEYSGIVTIDIPENCPCVEIPSRGELILPPGLVYAIRS